MGGVKQFQQYPGLEDDIRDLRYALLGLFPNERKVVEILGKRSQAHRESIAEGYKLLFAESLPKRLKASMSCKAERCLMLWMMDPSERDAVLLYEALRQGGPKKDRAVIGMLCTRSSAQLYLIKQAYYSVFCQTLENHLDGSGFVFPEPQNKRKWAFWRSAEPKVEDPPKRQLAITKLLLALARGSRPENTTVDRHIALTDAHQLNKVCSGKLGNEETLIRIFSTRSPYQLTATMNFYEQHYGHDFEKALSKKDAGEFLQALRAVVQCLRRPSEFYAEDIITALSKGNGPVDEDTLVQIITTRADVDMHMIRIEFMKECKRALEQVISERAMGVIGQFLVTAIRQRDMVFNSRPTSEGSTNSYYTNPLSTGSRQSSDRSQPDTFHSGSQGSSGTNSSHNSFTSKSNQHAIVSASGS